MSRRFSGHLVYDGTAYYGFQRQKAGTPTVQAAIEAALQRIARQPVTITGAGRTDTGVHASGQVIAFDLQWVHPVASLLQALNATLPADIALRSLQQVDPKFHPRFDAISRAYLYRIHLSPWRDPLRGRYVWHRRGPLDATIMQQAISVLVGEHDFATFGQPTVGTSTIRQMLKAAVHVVEDEIHIEMCANAFLQRMVRSITGTLVEVGRGKMPPEQFKAAFFARNRQYAGPTAPPQGLVLTRVDYPKSQ